MKARFLILPAIGLAIVAAAVTALLPENSSADVPTMVIHHEPFLQRVTAEGNLEAVTSTPLTVPITSGKRHKIAWLIEDGARVIEGEVIIRFDPTDFELDRDNGRDDQTMVDHRLTQAEVERNAKLKNLDRDAKLSKDEARNAREFKSTDTLVYSRIEIIESEIDTELAEQRAEHAEQSKTVQDKLTKTNLELLGIERKKAELKIRQAEDGLQSLQIVAPHDGIVIFERDWRGNIPRVGETVWPGRPVASIPQLDEMEAAVFVLEADAGGLAPEQPAKIMLEAHPGKSFTAKIKTVDPIAQRRIRWVPVQYFRVVLSIDETDNELMKPGQRVQAEIILAEEASAIAIPRQAVGTVEGRPMVYRLEDGAFEHVEVEIGASAIGKVVVTKGLADDDIIALRDPTLVIVGSTSPKRPLSLGGTS